MEDPLDAQLVPSAEAASVIGSGRPGTSHARYHSIHDPQYYLGPMASSLAASMLTHRVTRTGRTGAGLRGGLR